MVTFNDVSLVKNNITNKKRDAKLNALIQKCIPGDSQKG